MVEGGVIPGRGSVADFAGGREIARDMIWIRGFLKILLVTGVTGRGSSGIDAIRMAVGTIGRQVSSSE